MEITSRGATKKCTIKMTKNGQFEATIITTRSPACSYASQVFDRHAQALAWGMKELNIKTGSNENDN